jgi:hypothetical protein
MNQKWTNIEARSQHCTVSVVGTEKRYTPPDPLETVWTLDDALAGRCIESEVGSSRYPPAQRQLPPPDYVPPSPTVEEVEEIEEEHELVRLAREQGLKPNDVVGIGLILFNRDPARFMQNYPSIYNKLVDAQAKREAMQDSKLMETIATVTTADLRLSLLSIINAANQELGGKTILPPTVQQVFEMWEAR